MSWLNQAFLEAPFVATAAAGVTALLQLVTTLRNISQTRKLMDDVAFSQTLETADLSEIGKMLRDRLGGISLEAALDDAVIQAKIFRSLQRLTELVNQPSPVQSFNPEAQERESSLRDEKNIIASKKYENSVHLKQEAKPSSTSSKYIDNMPSNELLSISRAISEIVSSSYTKVQESIEIWTILASARRDLEKILLNKVPARFLTPQIFWDMKLKSGMSTFLQTANRAIHGEDVSQNEAVGSFVALKFVADRLELLSKKTGLEVTK